MAAPAPGSRAAGGQQGCRSAALLLRKVHRSGRPPQLCASARLRSGGAELAAGEQSPLPSVGTQAGPSPPPAHTSPEHSGDRAPRNSKLRAEGTSFKGTGSCQQGGEEEEHPHSSSAQGAPGRQRHREREAEHGHHLITAAGGEGRAQGAPSRLQGLLPSSATCTRRGPAEPRLHQGGGGGFGIHTGFKPRQRHSPTSWSPLASLVTAGGGGGGCPLPAPSPQQADAEHAGTGGTGPKFLS